MSVCSALLPAPLLSLRGRGCRNGASSQHQHEVSSARLCAGAPAACVRTALGSTQRRPVISRVESSRHGGFYQRIAGPVRASFRQGEEPRPGGFEEKRRRSSSFDEDSEWGTESDRSSSSNSSYSSGSSRSYSSFAFDSRPLLEKGSFRDLRRIALTGVLLGVLTSFELAVEGHLGGFVDGALSIMVQLVFALLLADVSLTLATWIVSQLTSSPKVGKCPWCNSPFMFDREVLKQLYVDSAMTGASARMSCPNCSGELVYQGMDSEPYFAKGTDPQYSPGFGFKTKTKSWASDQDGKVVDVEAVVRDKN